MPTIAEQQRYIKVANIAEEKYGLPKNLLVGIMKTESNFNNNAISKAGAKGLMQFMSGTAKEYGINPYNPSQSIDAAGKYLSKSYKTFGNWDDAIRSYNMGVGGVQKWKAGKRSLPKETAEYTGKVYKNASIPFKPTPISDEVIANTNQYFLGNPTTSLTNLQSSENIDTFTSENEEEKVEKDPDIEEVKKQTQEHNFLQEYQNIISQEQPIVEQEVTQEQPLPQPNLNEIYTQVSDFIDSGQEIAQQGRQQDYYRSMLPNFDTTSTQLFNSRVLPNMPVNTANKVQDVRKQGDLLRVPNSFESGANDSAGYVRTTDKLPNLNTIKDPTQRGAYQEFKDWYTNDVTKDRFQKNTGFDRERLQDFVGKGLRTPIVEAVEQKDKELLSDFEANAIYRPAYNQKYFGNKRNENTGEILYSKQGNSRDTQSMLGHEIGHASNVDTVLGKSLMRVLGDPHNQTKSTFNRTKDYLARPEESYGNFHEFRLNLGLKPGQTVDEKQLQQLVKEKGQDQNMFYTTYDNDKIVKAINTIASNNDISNIYAQQGKVIEDNNGQWTNPGEVTRINSPNITMQGVNYEVKGVSDQTGEEVMMQPNQNYFFKDTKSVTEYPQLTEREKSFLKHISKLR